MSIGFLIHKEGDSVGIATLDLKKGQEFAGRILSSSSDIFIRVREDIPFGHKLALRDFKNGEKLREYGEVIGRAVRNIRKGEHVHIHNLRSARW